MDDIILTLNGAKVCSRLDLYKAFHQIELDEASRVMTTFQTHIGLFRYKRLNFGVSAAPIIFQNELRQALQGLKGILNIADDIVCFGKTQAEHDANLRALLQRLQDRNLTLNSQKCSFGQSKIKFYGYVFSESGISPDPDKASTCKTRNKYSSEQYISFITDNALPDALKLSDVAKATETDCILSCVRNALEQNDWKTQKIAKLDENFRLYENLNKNQELAVAYTEDGFVLLRGTKLCLPESLQKQTVMLSQEGHQGQSTCKGLLREYCWFPHMDRMVEEICRLCIVCQAASTRITPDPIKPTLLPRDVFSEVSCDFCGPFPEGYMLLVVICDYSRFPVVERIKSTAADTVIPRLEAIFSIFGYPEVVKTDNGPPFQSRAFREFADNSGFKHKRITPLHPQANGIVERFMAPLQKAIKTAIASRQDYKRALSIYLMNFRNTPQTTTQTAPSELMFNRKLKTKLPKMTFDNKDTDIRDRDSLSKAKNKIYADKKRRAQRNSLKLGDRVLFKREQRNKFETAFDPTPG
ncbi:uncharacterized protein K02A2.6-like [Ruditapes philippinarum]|uniref:uncharacterized protein K02A2.6-like n=1 Tax=Ruditapes philippinarum TaxID=129788 RepID=UPI00295AC746|nr:uncharacterized protein K02A2.6-like [Ruditapes philippinarum]